MQSSFRRLLTPQRIALLSVFFLITITILTRLVPIWPGYFSFAYDNAKDSLVIMEMGTKYKPALFGAVTSIPGVFNGPLYYYAALPLNILFNYHPVAGVLTVLLFAVLSTWLAYENWGWWGGLLYATSLGVIGAQQSAWSPYMTVFITLPVIILLQQLAHTPQQKKNKSTKKRSQNKSISALSSFVTHNWQWIALFGLISFTFHFQTAFGVVLLPSVLLILTLLKIKPSWSQVTLSLLAFILPFAPLIAFELRHNFHQTKEVIKFVQDYGDQSQVIGDNKKGLGRVVEVSQYGLNTAAKSILPTEAPISAVGGLVVLIGATYVIDLYRTKEKNETLHPNIVIWSVMLLLPLAMYLLLPVKEYYLVALIPVWISLFADFLSQKVHMKAQYGVALLVICLSVLQIYRSRLGYQALAQETAALYEPKATAVELIYTLAEGRPFLSYHFVPEIYDYTYQHIYLRQRHLGNYAPADFSYAPGEVAYIQQKDLTPLPEASDLVYLIVEDYVYQDVFDSWKNRVTTDLVIINEYQVNGGITVYETIRSASASAEAVSPETN